MTQAEEKIKLELVVNSEKPVHRKLHIIYASLLEIPFLLICILY